MSSEFLCYSLRGDVSCLRSSTSPQNGHVFIGSLFTSVLALAFYLKRKKKKKKRNLYIYTHTHDHPYKNKHLQSIY